MPVYVVRYHAYIDEPSSDLTVVCPDGESTVERTLVPGDLAFGITSSNPKRGDLWLATTDGIVMPPIRGDVMPGDIVVVNCTQVDLPSQSGLAVVITTDGTFTPFQMQSAPESVQFISSTSTPVSITGDVVVADTTLGDVVAVLPDAKAGPTIRVGNVTGSGSFQINPPEGSTVDGGSTLILGPGDKATLVGIGTDWESW